MPYHLKSEILWTGEGGGCDRCDRLCQTSASTGRPQCVWAELKQLQRPGSALITVHTSLITGINQDPLP